MNFNTVTVFGGSQPGDALNVHDIAQTIDRGAVLRFVHLSMVIIDWLISMSLPSRFPRWGTRLHCSKIPDGDTNL